MKGSGRKQIYFGPGLHSPFRGPPFLEPGVSVSGLKAILRGDWSFCDGPRPLKREFAGVPHRTLFIIGIGRLWSIPAPQ